MKSKKLTEKQVIGALRRLEKGWPDSLWLFSVSGTLCLMRTGKDPETGIEDIHVRVPRHEGMDPDYCIASFNIDNDGGDW